LPAADVFYFGNAIGETGNNATNAIINIDDARLIRANRADSVSSGSRAGSTSTATRVNVDDVGLTRANVCGFTPILLIAPPVAQGLLMASDEEVVAAGSL
jgi:hypothetical protein